MNTITAPVTVVTNTVLAPVTAAADAYQLAVRDGFVGNRAAWLASLVGAAGAAGAAGGLTGTALAATVTASSLTSVGTLAALTTSGLRTYAAGSTFAYADTTARDAHFAAIRPQALDSAASPTFAGAQIGTNLFLFSNKIGVAQIANTYASGSVNLSFSTNDRIGLDSSGGDPFVSYSTSTGNSELNCVFAGAYSQLSYLNTAKLRVGSGSVECLTALSVGGQSLAGTQATSLLDLSTTWNTTGNPAMIYGRVKNTASGSTANLLDLGTVAGGSLFKVDKTGAVNAPSISGNGSAALLIMSSASNSFGAVLFNHAGSPAFAVLSGALGIGLRNAGCLSWAPSDNANATGDLFLFRDAANTLAQRNGTNAQASRIYTTFVARGAGTTNLEAMEMKSVAAGSFIIQSLKGSAGGTARDIEFRHGATDTNGVITNGTALARVAAAGFTILPLVSSTPASNGDLTFEATSNTSLTIKFKGSDGTVRTNVLTLA